MTLDEFKAWLAEPGANATPAAKAPLGADSPAFKEWFGDSKVVDKKGKPMMMFHGSQSQEAFEVFEPKGSFGGWNNVGTWFSNKPHHAAIFANTNPFSEIGEETAQIIPAYLSIKKPFDTTFENLMTELDQAIGEHEFATGEKIDKFGVTERTAMETSKVGLFFRDYLKERGYDGIVLRDWEGDGKPAQDVFVAFESEQIKSAYGNSGAYDKANKNIMYAAGRDLLSAPNDKWIQSVLEGGEKKMGDIPDTMPLNVAVSELLQAQEQYRSPDTPLPPKKPSLNVIQRSLDSIEKAMPGAPVTLLENYRQAPKAVVDTMMADGLTQVKAVFDPQTNQIYMFGDQIMSADEAVRTALHEKTHRGLREAFGVNLDSILDEVFVSVSEKRQADMQTIADKYKLDPGKLQDRRIIAEELLAHMAENDVKNSLLQKAVAAIRQVLRKMGFAQKFTDSDIHALIREAQGAVSRTRDNLAGVMIEEEVMVEGSEEVYIVEQDAQVLITEVDKRIEICGKLRNCL